MICELISGVSSKRAGGMRKGRKDNKGYMIKIATVDAWDLILGPAPPEKWASASKNCPSEGPEAGPLVH